MVHGSSVVQSQSPTVSSELRPSLRVAYSWIMPCGPSITDISIKGYRHYTMYGLFTKHDSQLSGTRIIYRKQETMKYVYRAVDNMFCDWVLSNMCCMYNAYVRDHAFSHSDDKSPSWDQVPTETIWHSKLTLFLYVKFLFYKPFK